MAKIFVEVKKTLDNKNLSTWPLNDRLSTLLQESKIIIKLNRYKLSCYLKEASEVPITYYLLPHRIKITISLSFFKHLIISRKKVLQNLLLCQLNWKLVKNLSQDQPLISISIQCVRRNATSNNEKCSSKWFT